MDALSSHKSRRLTSLFVGLLDGEKQLTMLQHDSRDFI